MDFIRTSLILGLAVVAYMLVLQWNEDFPSEPPATLTTETSVFDEAPAQVDLDVPAESTQTGELTPPEELAEPSLAQPEEVTPPGGEITLVTDVLGLKIDLKGGNVVHAALRDYSVSLNNPRPLEIFKRGNGQFFVAESSLLGKDGFDSSKNGPAPVYRTSQNKFTLGEGEDTLQVDLTYERDGINVIKRYEIQRGRYEIKVSYLVNNQSSETWQANFAAKLRRDKSPDPTQSGGFGAVSYLGAVISTPENPYEKVTFEDMEEDSLRVVDPKGWIAFVQHYFVSAWVPDSEQNHTYQTRYQNGLYLMGYVDPAFRVEPGQQVETGATLYVGPKILERLQEVAPNLDLTIDFGFLWLIAKPLFLVLEFIHDYVGNWGVAIILLTVLIKAIFFHLSAASYRSMANMRRVTPELTRIREQYGDDRQKMSQAMMELYKKEKINPLGGCLPILVQMPVFIALYWVLLESVELRQAPFMLWIQDLSIKDPFFILPLAMGATMFLQMSLNPTPPDPMQARIMKMMPIIFTVFFLWFPAGLVLYWLVNNILSILQQWVITRKIEKEGAKAS